MTDCPHCGAPARPGDLRPVVFMCGTPAGSSDRTHACFENRVIGFMASLRAFLLKQDTLTGARLDSMWETVLRRCDREQPPPAHWTLKDYPLILRYETAAGEFATRFRYPANTAPPANAKAGGAVYLMVRPVGWASIPPLRSQLATLARRTPGTTGPVSTKCGPLLRDGGYLLRVQMRVATGVGEPDADGAGLLSEDW